MVPCGLVTKTFATGRLLIAITIFHTQMELVDTKLYLFKTILFGDLPDSVILLINESLTRCTLISHFKMDSCAINYLLINVFQDTVDTVHPHLPKVPYLLLYGRKHNFRCTSQKSQLQMHMHNSTATVCFHRFGILSNKTCV